MYTLLLRSYLLLTLSIKSSVLLKKKRDEFIPRNRVINMYYNLKCFKFLM